MRELLVLGLLSFVFSGCSCGDPCDPNTDIAHCDGNTVVSCPPPGVDAIVGTNRWSRTDCGAHQSCIGLSTEAFCALSTTPDPSCDGGVEAACENDHTQLDCRSGFATYRLDCLSCTNGDAGVNCAGGPSKPCTSNAGCAPSLECDSDGFCTGKSDGG
ncbi:MAG: hypothetical protein ACJ790_21455 [Myxococcaceae bacterium]